MQYNITVEIVHKRQYPIEADTLSEAYTKALEQAVEQYPGADVWLHGYPRIKYKSE